MKKQIRKFGNRVEILRKITFRFLSFLLVFSIILNGAMTGNHAHGVISPACKKSPECMEAVNDEKAANEAALQANSSANFYQAKVSELNSSIAAMKLKIADTKAQIAELSDQIEKTQKKLELEQGALAELLIDMHFESDVEPITVLAGSSSISDLAERASRAEVAKQQIAVAAAKIKDAKLKLEEDRARVEQLLEEQEIAEADLIARKSEQQALVEKFKNDAKAYEAQVLAAREAQRAAEKAYRDEHPELLSYYYEGVDTYSEYIRDLGLETVGFGFECPRDWDIYTTSIDGEPIGGLICECVSYVGWKAYEYYGLKLNYGNAYDWKWRAELDGFVADNNPTVGSFGWTSYGIYGHVFWVENVNADGSIDVTDYNWNIDGSFTARTIPAGYVSSFYYIHLHD